MKPTDTPVRKCSVMMISLLLVLLFTFSGGCSLFHKETSPLKEKNKETQIFDSEREKQNELAEYTSSAGRSDPKQKKKVAPGQMFLLSDKAKEIYQNTER